MFSHSEDSDGYSSCDNKYGDISNDAYNYPFGPVSFATARPYGDITSNIISVNIENKIKPKNMAYWFYNISGNISGLTNIDTSQCASLNGCFYGNKAGISLDLSSWDTSNVTNMASLFSSSKYSSVNVSNWDTSKATTMQYMFAGNPITSLNLSSFDTGNVTSMENMFAYCENLSSITYGNRFVKKSGCNTSGMFSGCLANKPDWW